VKNRKLRRRLAALEARVSALEPPPPDLVVPDLGWWCIAGDSLMSALKRAYGGDDPTVVFAELYANADHADHAEPPEAED
jgi:hypothetical protein